MKNTVTTVEVPIEFLTELLNLRKEFFKVCETFSIPVDKRGEAWVGEGINERIRTYITSYVMKRSITEKENGAAFPEKIQPLIADPTT